MLVLKTPPSGAQPLAAAVDAEHWKEVAGTLAGDDTVLIISTSRGASQRHSEAHGGNAPMNDPSRVAVVGATGYAGFELARLLLRHPHIGNTDILSARGPRECPLPDGAFSATARLGRSAVQAAFRGSRCEERGGSRVSFDAARGFARARAGIARGKSWTAHRGFERRIPLPQAGNIRQVVQAAAAGCGGSGEGRLWTAGAVCRCAAGGAARGKSGLLSHVGDFGPAAAGRGGLDQHAREGLCAIASRA